MNPKRRQEIELIIITYLVTVMDERGWKVYAIDDGVFPIKVSLFEIVGGPTKEYLVDLILIPRYDVRSLPDEADY